MPIGTGLAVGSAISAIPGIIQSITGIGQNRQAKKYREEFERPDFEIPDSLNDALNFSRGLTHTRELPGQSYYENLIGGATSRGLDAVKEMGLGGEGFGAVANMVAGEQKQLAGMNASLAQMVQGNQGQYLGMLNTMAEAESKKWQWEEADPYLQAMQLAKELEGAGKTNMFEGFKDTVGVGANLLSTPGAFGNPDTTSGFSLDAQQFKKLIESLKP